MTGFLKKEFASAAGMACARPVYDLILPVGTVGLQSAHAARPACGHRIVEIDYAAPRLGCSSAATAETHSTVWPGFAPVAFRDGLGDRVMMNNFGGNSRGAAGDHRGVG